MILSFDQTNFNQLFPFSFTTTAQGHIAFIGSSLKTLFPELKEGASFQNEFKVVRPHLGIKGTTPEFYLGELVILEKQLNPHNLKARPVRFRGGVLKLQEHSDTFLFSIVPNISSISEIKDLQIDFSHFPLGTPIFDFLLLIHNERSARAKAELAQKQLTLDNKISQLLHRHTTQSVAFNDTPAALKNTLEQVCTEFDWSVGHAYLINETEDNLPQSSDLWYFKHETQFLPLKSYTEKHPSLLESELSVEALKNNHIAWNELTLHKPIGERQKLCYEIGLKNSVGVPILIQGQLIGVMEFLFNQDQASQQKMEFFFEILGSQVSSIIERQKAHAREREHFAELAMSSKLSTLGEMAAGIAHEVNNPLSVIILGIQRLEKLLATLPQDNLATLRAIFDRIRMAADRINKIILGLKTFSRDGRYDDLIATSLKNIVEETLVLCQARFEKSGVRFMMGDVPLDIRINCRAVQISQALLNLLNNALDAALETHDPWVRLDFKEHHELIEISVTDSGSGIRKELLDKIMRPFFTTKPVGKGTGLGLSISASILKAHKGSLKYDSTATNTRFVLLIPKA